MPRLSSRMDEFKDIAVEYIDNTGVTLSQVRSSFLSLSNSERRQAIGWTNSMASAASRGITSVSPEEEPGLISELRRARSLGIRMGRWV